MHQETELLVQAIESLKQEINPFKDYIFPILSGFFASLLGAGIAFFVMRHHEYVQIEKEKMDVINKFTLKMNNAFNSLVAIKGNYHGELDKNPFQRVLKVPALVGNSRLIDEDISVLFFLVPKDEDKKPHIKWRNIIMIEGVISNYNSAIKIWEKRSELDRPIREEILKTHSNLGFADVTKDMIFDCVDPTEFISLIDLTERALILTDDLIIELNDFMTEFPNIGKSLVDVKKLKRYGSILTINTSDNPLLVNMLVKNQEVDYEVLSKLYGRPVEQIKHRYSTGY